MENEMKKIIGIPLEDGAYWYYKRGSIMPSLVLVGTYKGERAIKEGGVIQRYWFPGEFFVGPVRPPHATPEELVVSQPGTHGEGLFPTEASGIAITE